MTTARVLLWGETVGAVTWLDNQSVAAFEFSPDFLKQGLDVAPITMPLGKASQVFTFRNLNTETFKGLPGFLADALPDKFGNAVINAWLARQGRDAASLNPVERLCYVGSRGMGALEFQPAHDDSLSDGVTVEISALVELAREITEHRGSLQTSLSSDFANTADNKPDALLDIIRVGTSAGGARAKAVIAINDDGDVRSGQVQAPAGYSYWLLKFDGVTDLELGASAGYGRIEYAYYKMALAAGITMSECRLLEEGERAHFLTRRFDRNAAGKKRHMTSLCGIAHYDFNLAGAYGYEQAFSCMRELRLPASAAAEQFRRMVFNVVARNQDDHTKNISFLMNPNGEWSLSPAFDVTYAHNPAGEWTNQHQMTIAGKRDGFTRDDLLALAKGISLKRGPEIIEQVKTAVRAWPQYAEMAGVDAGRAQRIALAHRLSI